MHLELATGRRKLQQNSNLQPPHPSHPPLSGAVLDEQSAHTEVTKLPSPLEFRKDSEEENRDSEKDEDTRELEAVTCEHLPVYSLTSVLPRLPVEPRSTSCVQVALCRRPSLWMGLIWFRVYWLEKTRVDTRQACQGCHLVAMSQSAADVQTRSSWKKN